MAIDSAVYAFTGDFVDAGINDVADDLAGKGFSAVALGTVYHAARDLLPHNPKRLVAHRSEGAHYFVSDASAYTGPLRLSAEADPTAGQFSVISAALAQRDMSWQAWTVYLHNCRLAIEHPRFAVTNAFGDRYVTDLCPSHDDVATYAVELTADVVRLAPSLVVAESLHHCAFGHGYHHERAFVDVGAVAAFLLSLCFCDACIANGAVRGVDAGTLRERVRVVIRRAIGSPAEVPDTLSLETLADLCGDTMLDYLHVREQTVTDLVARCADTARAAGVPFGFIDQTGALKGYLTGDPQGALAADDAWRLGIAPAAVASAVDSYVVLAYARNAIRVGSDVEAYAACTGDAAALRCVLRHGGVDYVDPAQLAARVEAAASHGAAAVDFYHYGLMPLAGLDAAGSVVRRNGSRRD